MYNVLVACLENWDTLGELPFVLSQGGCNVDVFCSKKSWLISNSYYHNWIESPADTDQYIRHLVSLVQNPSIKYDWVIPADEMLLNLLNDAINDEELFYKILPLTKIQNRELLGSKAGLSKLCDKYGISRPKYFVYRHSDSINVRSLQLNYPLLLKQDLSWGGGGILYCENEQELLLNLEKTNPKYDTVIQEFIKGEDIGVEALFRKGELIEYNAGLITTYFANKFDFTTRRIYFDDKRLANEIANIGAKLGVNGFASIQFIYNTDADTYYLIEVDARPNIWLPMGRFTGHAFSEAVTKFLDGSLVGAIAHVEGRKTEVAHFYRDTLRNIKRFNITGAYKWLTNYKGYRRFIPSYDKVLMKRMMEEIFINKMLKIISFGKKE